MAPDSRLPVGHSTLAARARKPALTTLSDTEGQIDMLALRAYRLGRVRELIRFRAGNLYGYGFRVEIEVEAMSRLRRLPQARVGRRHLRRGHTGTVAAADPAERGIRNTGHRRQHERAREGVGTDCQSFATHGREST